MSSLQSIQSYQSYYNIKCKRRSLEHKCFHDYVARQMKYSKKFSRDTFGMVCRLTYILGEPMGIWITTNGKNII